MDLTQGSINEKTARAKKMMLWFGMISIAMMFAGLTSAYVVSKSRPDWLIDFQIPTAFFWSTAAILLSSLLVHLSLRSSKNQESGLATLLLLGGFTLGITFIILQFMGFSQIVADGYYFTGEESTITTSFLYAIVFSHVVHVIAGMVVLAVMLFNQYRGKYANGQTLGFELGAMFWHFLDFLWLYLIVFFYFFR
ncbi:cytochrome c oxidase subunit 3 [Robertkochia aurantiaca]|uniref:cytochrome c oxidase subunit 3 n=1 Tax=Robertkochia aurantiaca TaxID=2873700 RepID=UPI001CC9DBB4|nr:cytochrome c oxidase subunit 3 [Robertkochia sp. 3YJGBD-33]